MPLTPNNSLPTITIEDILDQAGQVLLQQRFYSDDSSWTEYYLIVWTSRTIYYETLNNKKTLLWTMPTSEIWIWQPLKANSLWYFIGEEGIVRMDLYMWEIDFRAIFREVGIWPISQVSIMPNIILGQGGVCQFRGSIGLMRNTVGESLANKLYWDIEQDIQWRYTSSQLWIGHLEQVFSGVYGTIILGNEWIAICDRSGNLLCRKRCSELEIQKIVQVYENWWIVGQNEKVQLNFKDGTLLTPATSLNIGGFLEFQKENSHSLMGVWEWIMIPEKSQEVTIIQEVTAWLAISKL